MAPKTKKTKKTRKTKKLQLLTGESGAIAIFNAHLALGFAPTETPILISNLPAPFERNAHLCAIRALTLSLNATRALHEGPNVVPYTVRQIAMLLESPEYAQEVDRIGRTPFALPDHDDIYGLRTYLDRAQLAVLLGILNRRNGTNYVLGFLTHETNTVNIEATGGPIVWLGHTVEYGEPHFVAFTREPAEFDDAINSSLDRYENTTAEDLQDLVDRGLYRVTQPIPGGSGLPAGVVGEFVFRLDDAGLPGREGFIRARIGENNAQGMGVGLVPLSHLEQINTVTPRRLAPRQPGDTEATDKKGKKRKIEKDPKTTEEPGEPEKKKRKSKKDTEELEDPNVPEEKATEEKPKSPPNVDKVRKKRVERFDKDTSKAPPEAPKDRKIVPLPKRSKPTPKTPPKAPDESAPVDEYDDKAVWPYKRFQQEVRDRKAKDSTLKGPWPLGWDNYRAWMRENDAKKKAAKSKSKDKSKGPDSSQDKKDKS